MLSAHRRRWSASSPVTAMLKPGGTDSHCGMRVRRAREAAEVGCRYRWRFEWALSIWTSLNHQRHDVEIRGSVVVTRTMRGALVVERFESCCELLFAVRPAREGGPRITMGFRPSVTRSRCSPPSSLTLAFQLHGLKSSRPPRAGPGCCRVES